MFASTTRGWVCRVSVAAAVLVVSLVPSQAAEHVTLKNGFELVCVRRDMLGDRIRLYIKDEGGKQIYSRSGLDGRSYLEVSASEILSIDEITPSAGISMANSVSSPAPSVSSSPAEVLLPEQLHAILASAGSRHNVDADLLASMVRAESAGRVRAVSRTGAKGLMQLMPGTASSLGVTDSFAAEQNIAGGSAYLDALLKRYHDNIPLAVAAYNAGPAAVDRYHGVPPYRETRAYVARVIIDFNRRKQIALQAPAPKLISNVR